MILTKKKKNIWPKICAWKHYFI